MWPRSGRTAATVDAPFGEWEHDVEHAGYGSTPPPATTDLVELDGGVKRTSEASLADAFGSSNVEAALSSDGVPNAPMRSMLRLQSGEASAQHANILPHSRVRPHQMLDDFYLGDSGVEHSYKASTMVDRLGNEFDVWESHLPPPDKDYRSTAPSSSQRHLERCQGGNPYFHDRPKREVEQVLNPPEARGDGEHVRERNSLVQLKGRQMFFNQASLQGVASMDVGRENYDGYNVSTPYAQLVPPVEKCWRPSQANAPEPTATLTLPAASVRSVMPSRRCEHAGAYARKPARAIEVSGKSSRLTLPVVSDATVRSEGCGGVTSLGAHGLSLPVAHDAKVDHSMRTELGSLAPTRPQLVTSARVANPYVVSSAKMDGKTDPANDAVSSQGPLQFASKVLDKERGDTSRGDQGAIVKPVARREGPNARRIDERVDQLAGDVTRVDGEQYAALSSGIDASRVREDCDHVLGEGLVYDERRDAHEQTSVAPQVHATACVGGTDVIGVDSGALGSSALGTAALNPTAAVSGTDASAIDEGGARQGSAVLRPLAPSYAYLTEADRGINAHEPNAANDAVGDVVRAGADEPTRSDEPHEFARVDAAHAEVARGGDAERGQGRDAHHAASGLVKHSRVDSAANVKESNRLTPAPVTLSNDRSTPIPRAVTPVIAHQRMHTPLLQTTKQRELPAQRVAVYHPNASLVTPQSSRTIC